MVKEEKKGLMKTALQNLIPHEIGSAEKITTQLVAEFFSNRGISSDAFTLHETMNNAVGDILAGCFLLFFDNWTQIISVKASRKSNRSIDEPVSEPVVLGPRKGTVDGLDVNIGIIRSQLPTPNLKVHIFHTNGPKKTQVMYAYVKDTIKEEVLIEFKNRISKIDKEVILDPSYIEGLIEDSSYSIFPQHRYTERSDVAVSALLEGKIIVMVDGSGMILICPGLFIEAFQSVEDYYRRTICFTGTYLKITRFHYCHLSP
jgi:spore germination protein KA/spore germination protein